MNIDRQGPMDQLERAVASASGGAAMPWWDIAVVIAVTALTLVLSVRFQLNEALYAATRHFEWFQADELPIAMLAFSVSLIWLAWRRYRHAERELVARRITEARLAAVIEDNRRLARENRRIQEDERKYLARELHDELGQYLNAIKLDAVAIRTGPADPEQCRRAAEAIVSAVDHVHGAVSEMIARLRPVGLDELGLRAALEHSVERWRARQAETHVRLALHGDLDTLPEATSLTLYRLIQESLTNVEKHARARSVDIVLECSGEGAHGAIRLTIADDGCGMDPHARSDRFGLQGMRERVEAAGGEFRIESAPGRGTRVMARLPVAAP